MPGLEVKTESSGFGSSYEGGTGPYEGYSREWSYYSGVQVRYLPDGHGVVGDIGWSTSKIDVDFDVSPGDVVFVVVVVYTTGGTFGQTSGNTQVVAVFNDADKAVRLEEVIREDNKKNRSSFKNIEFEGMSIYPGSWKGYFESLDDVKVETEVVRA